MPAKRRYSQVPRWIDELDDRCLYEVAIEAWVARRSAVRAGADKDDRARRILAAADQTMDQVASGRVTGQRACRLAATATRKYNSALERMERLAS